MGKSRSYNFSVDLYASLVVLDFFLAELFTRIWQRSPWCSLAKQTGIWRKTKSESVRDLLSLSLLELVFDMLVKTAKCFEGIFCVW